ncbi:hypothetical protein [Roseibacillus persicicus]|uniref:hypothetical protein n=1 Tax=Roseibacillus persicicus TaxID=454148 RepID=UPI00280E81D5|nr:hypothetical protein [Roseibacillus persicicus]MDQ8192075.1 hypothetical protein [Roseibacillus persicicus]
MKNVVTLKWGTRYGPEFANRLFHAVRTHLSEPFEFHCFTDDATGLNSEIKTHPIPEIDLPPHKLSTGWRKLTLFQPGLPLSGPSLFLDLDIIVRGSLDSFFEFAPGKIPIIHNWSNTMRTITGRRPEVGNSSIFRFLPNEHTFVYEQYLKEKDWALETFNPPQTYLTHCIKPIMEFYPESWTASFKRHCRPVFPLNLLMAPREPKSAQVVVFHGRPDPDEALNGFEGKKLHHRTKPAKWIEKYWTVGQ